MNKLLFIIAILILNINGQNVYIFGFVNVKSGIGKVSYSFLQCLLDFPGLQMIKQVPSPEQTYEPKIKKIIKNASVIINQDFSKDIIIYTNVITTYTEQDLAIPAYIKLAYSMTECTQLDSSWVKRLNKYFDAVMVPDRYYIEVYKNSGVTIPIFELPMSLDLNPILTQPIKSFKNEKFVFGYSAGFGISKNYDLLIEAFKAEFSENPNVILKLHGLGGYYFDEIKNKIKTSSNIYLDNAVLSTDEYINFLKKLDCYVTFSKGEGFSITPREAMALGVPCIVSNNTSHITICNSGFVYSVKSDIVEPHTSNGKDYCGFDFNCSLNDARKALRELYDNYNENLKNGIKGRNWVKKYLPERLKNKYLNLIKPKKLRFGPENIIADSYLMTNSLMLYRKYKNIK
ncbi:MAG: glycosyltransferase [Candidatus Babeliales bacterium]|nr:glycosyltransferase [Candidatus Babeliales bacterium]